MHNIRAGSLEEAVVWSKGKKNEEDRLGCGGEKVVGENGMCKVRNVKGTVVWRTLHTNWTWLEHRIGREYEETEAGGTSGACWCKKPLLYLSEKAV